TSVGFMPTQKPKVPTKAEREALGMPAYGVIYEGQELLEISLVSVPANPQALQNAFRRMLHAGEVTDGQVEEFAETYAMTDADRRAMLRHLKRHIVDMGAETRGGFAVLGSGNSEEAIMPIRSTRADDTSEQILDGIQSVVDHIRSMTQAITVLGERLPQAGDSRAISGAGSQEVPDWTGVEAGLDQILRKAGAERDSDTEQTQ
ncbi:MAG: hypothetical protein ACPGWS_06765, partial [Solirubrobacterales bacterium]